MAESCFQDSGSAHPTKRPPVSVKSLAYSLRAVSAAELLLPDSRPRPLSLEPSLAVRFLPSPASRRSETHLGPCPGVSSLRKAPLDSSPSAASLHFEPRLLTHFRRLPPPRPCTSRLSSLRRTVVPPWCYPLVGGRSPPQVFLLWDPNLPRPPPDRSRTLVPLMALGTASLTPPK